MDDDDIRRGKPTCHKIFGEANAILAGDALLTLAFNVIAKCAQPKKALSLIREISAAAGVDGMVGGQTLDIEYGGRKKVPVPIKRKIDLLKTAKLFEVSTKAGAIIAGADSKKTRALQKFGLYFGLSFQMVDDHIDGANVARGEALTLIEKAKGELGAFGKKADKLKAIADYAVKREI
jgi:geranylgeranyl diphosphate synthase type II